MEARTPPRYAAFANSRPHQLSAIAHLTPAKAQALDYFPGLKDVDLPRYILVSDFQTFELYDLDEGSEVNLLELRS